MIKEKQMMKLSTPPFAPKVVQTLHNCGINDLKDLRAKGACYAFLLLKASGLTVTESVFRQLVCACENCLPEDLDEITWQMWRQKLKQHPPVAIFPAMQEMEKFMQQALLQAQKAADENEVPVGAVVVKEGQIIAAAHNCCVGSCDISRHAEIQALAQAGEKVGSYRLDDCDVYITLEPCTMCAGALVQARVARVIYAAAEPKTGAAGSVLNVFAQRVLNSHTAVLGGVMAEESQKLLQQFFQNKRKG